MQKTGKVLVGYADDHTMFRKLLIKHLEVSSDIRVIVQGDDGKMLLNKIVQLGILPDVCLIDINMPNMGGHELLCKIREQWPSVKCIVLTAFNDDVKIINMIRHGACGYLLKNSDPEEVITAIKEVHHHGYYYSDVANSRLYRLILKDKIEAHTFTELETTFMKYACSSLTYAEIAQKMDISYRSLDSYRDKLFFKLEVSSRIGIVIAAIELGIFSINSKQNIKTKQ